MLVSMYYNNNNKTRPGMSETESHVSASDDADEHLKKSYFNNQQSSWQNMQKKKRFLEWWKQTCFTTLSGNTAMCARGVRRYVKRRYEQLPTRDPNVNK